MRCVFLLLLVLLGCGTSNISTGYAETLPLSSASQPEAVLTQKDIVGLWSGSVRMPGRTDIWQFLPKFIHYNRNGTAVTIYLNNTVLFRKDGTFKFTVEDENTASQYEGNYTVKDAVLMMIFSSASSGAGAASGLPAAFRYPISRWNDELMLNDEKEPGFQTLLNPLVQNWKPRKGSLVYQSPSGPMEVGTTGNLDQSYHYDEKGITHYATLSASWHLVPAPNPHNAPLAKLEGVHDGFGFKTMIVPLAAVPGLANTIALIKADKTAAGYSYSLQLFEVADIKPTVYVWGLHFEYQDGWEISPAPLPSAALYPSLSSPELRDAIARLPRGTRITYHPRMRLGFGSKNETVDPSDPEYGISDFQSYCKSQDVQFYLNEIYF